MATTTRTIEMANFASDGDSMTKTVSLPDYVDLQNVSVDVEAAGDLNSSSENFDYYLDGSLEGGGLSTGVQDCTYRDVWTNRDVTNYFDGKSSVQLTVNSSSATDEGFDCTGTAIKVKSVFTIDYVNTSPPSTPQNPASTYIADDQIDFSFGAPADWGGETGSYDVQILRDSGLWSDPAGGPSNPSSSGTYSYGPNSDTAYDRQVGIDSSFRFRVRAQNSAGSSSWAYSDTVYTSPNPPHNPNVSRPDSNKIDLSWSSQSDITNAGGVQYREDSGSGYGSWTDAKSGLEATGSDAVVDIPDINWPGGPVTVSFWNYVKSSENTNSSAFGTDDPDGNRFQCHAPWGNEDIYWDYGDNGSHRVETDYSDYMDRWTHVTLVSEGAGGSFQAIYLNGSEAVSGTVSDGFSTARSEFNLFREFGDPSGDYHHGKIADFRIYNRVLSPSEVSDLYNGVNITNSLQHRYKMTGTGSTVSDSAGNADGTITDLTRVVGVHGGSFKTDTNEYLSEDSRYQFRARSVLNDSLQSDWVYADYGNEGNVYFEDDFESGDLSAWDSTNLDDSWGVVDASFVDPNASSDDQTSNNRVHPVTNPDEGSYYLFGDGYGSVTKNLGDLSGESDVIVKCAFAVGSMDSVTEEAEVQWYDGSNWQTLEALHWEYNRQEWIEITALVPDSYLSTNNKLRLNGHGGSGDYAAWDRVVVSDILHEYTKPAAPTNVSASGTSNSHEVSVSWDKQVASLSEAFQEVRVRVDGSGDPRDKYNVNLSSSATFNVNDGFDHTVPQRDGEQYEIRVDSLFQQFRHGTTEDYPRSVSGDTTAITKLPAPTSLSVSNIGTNSADLSWTDNHDYGDVEVQFKLDSDTTWTTDSTISIGTQSENLTSLSEATVYDARVLASTEHTTTEDI